MSILRSCFYNKNNSAKHSLLNGKWKYTSSVPKSPVTSHSSRAGPEVQTIPFPSRHLSLSYDVMAVLGLAPQTSPPSISAGAISALTVQLQEDRCALRAISRSSCWVFCGVALLQWACKAWWAPSSTLFAARKCRSFLQHFPSMCSIPGTMERKKTTLPV